MYLPLAERILMGMTAPLDGEPMPRACAKCGQTSFARRWTLREWLRFGMFTPKRCDNCGEIQLPF